MVTYPYRCVDCGTEFEVTFDGMVGVTIPNTTPVYCPKCGSDLVFRLIKNATFILKGTGWASKKENINE
jgi:putative FmdB family regulatory protein